MNERAAFVRAICESPDEDTVRLVFADWLEEYGGEPERAEFIRVQVRLANFPPTIPQPTDIARERELLSNHSVWSAAIAAVVNLKVEDIIWGISDMPDSHGWNLSRYWRYYRGFIGELTCTATDFFKHADALLWHPGQNRPCPETAQPIRRVKLTTWPELTIGLDNVGFSGRKHRTSGPTTIQSLLTDEWPGVEFELPTPATGNINWLTMQVNTGTAENPNWQPIAGHRMSHDGHQEVTVDGVNWFRPDFVPVG